MRAVRSIVAVLALVILAMTGAAASTTGGTAIVNAATVSYTDGARAFSSQSNTVAETVAAVSALVVSPKNAAVNASTDTYVQNAPVTRTFTITNTSNISDAYVLTGVSASAGAVTGVNFAGGSGNVPAGSGAVSPTVPPGGSIAVNVTVATTGVPLGTPISVTIVARTTVAGTQTGFVSDSGRQWAVALGAPQFGGLGGGTTTIAKTVDGVASETGAPGGAITYRIAFENWGAIAATNAKLTDVVPLGIHADASTVKLNGTAIAATLNGQTLTVALGTVAPNVPMSVTFAATIDHLQTIGASFVNVASLAADGVATLATTPASVFVGSTNVVFDGMRGAQAPIAGALVTLVDATTSQPMALGTLAGARATAALPAAVNPHNANPFRTDASGVYGFLIPVPAGGPVNLDILVSANGYLNRVIGATIAPDASGFLYTVTLTSKDGQPLAAAGGYALTTTSVRLSDVFSLLGNLPLFAPQSIDVSKTADKTQAAPGDRVAYTIALTSNGQNAVGTTTIADTLPAGLAYAPGTARLDGAAIEPIAAGGHLTWTLSGLQPAVTHTVTYECAILPSVPSGTTLTNTVNVTGGVAGTHLNATGFGSVSVVAVGGVFTTQAVIAGRVFIDDAHTGHFRLGDRVLDGVRLYLESGEGVVTDRAGRYSFPGVRGGMHVLRLDETTLPATARVGTDRRYDSPHSPIRLIHGTMDLGLLQDVNFALEPVR